MLVSAAAGGRRRPDGDPAGAAGRALPRRPGVDRRPRCRRPRRGWPAGGGGRPLDRGPAAEPVLDRVRERLADDLDTPAALAAVDRWARRGAHPRRPVRRRPRAWCATWSTRCSASRCDRLDPVRPGRPPTLTRRPGGRRLSRRNVHPARPSADLIARSGDPGISRRCRRSAAAAAGAGSARTRGRSRRRSPRGISVGRPSRSSSVADVLGDLVVLGGHLVHALLPLVGLLGQVGQRHRHVEHLLDPVQQRERRLRVRRLGHVVRHRRPERDRRDARPGRRRPAGRRRCPVGPSYRTAQVRAVAPTAWSSDDVPVTGSGRVCGVSASSAPSMHDHLARRARGSTSRISLAERPPAHVRLDAAHRAPRRGRRPGGRHTENRVVGHSTRRVTPSTSDDRRPVDLEVVVVLRVERGQRLGVPDQLQVLDAPRWRRRRRRSSPRTRRPAPGSRSSGQSVELGHATSAYDRRRCRGRRPAARSVRSRPSVPADEPAACCPRCPVPLSTMSATRRVEPRCTTLPPATSSSPTGRWARCSRPPTSTLDDFEGLEGCNEILNVTRPDIVRGVHDAYLAVGVRLRRDQHLRRQPRPTSASTTSPTGSASSPRPAPGIAREVADDWSHAGPAALGARLDRAGHQAADPRPRRRTPTLRDAYQAAAPRA